MKIAVLSDIHDNVWNLEKILIRVKKEKCEAIIFCGDYCSPTTFKTLAEFGLAVYAIFGNVDGAKYEIMTAIRENSYRVNQKNDLLEIKLSGKKIAVCHKPEFAGGLAATGKYDVVFYGHTHQAKIEKIRGTILANPGEVMGKEKNPSFGVYDTKTEDVKLIELDNQFN